MVEYLIYPTLVGGFMLACSVWLGHSSQEFYDLIPSFLAVPTLLIVAWLERVRPFRKDWQADAGDRMPDLLHTFLFFPVVLKLSQLAAGLLSAHLGAQLFRSPFPEGTSTAAIFLAALLVAELFFHFIHRAAHKFFFLWNLHRIHHGASRVYWANAGRFHPVDLWVTMTIYFLPLYFLHVPAEVLTLFIAVNVVTGLLEHANIQFKCGWLNYVFNTAELHRWHHDIALETANHNFGKVLSVWDSLFGTIYFPFNKAVSVVGVDDPFGVVPNAIVQQFMEPVVFALTRQKATSQKSDLLNRCRYYFSGGPAFARSFILFGELGFDTSIVFGHQQRGQVRVSRISHVDYDGMNGFVSQLQESGALMAQSFPAIPKRKKKSLLFGSLNRLRQYLVVLKQFTAKSREWHVADQATQTAETIAWRFFTAEETAQIRKHSTQCDVSLNSFLFYRLHCAVSPFLEESALPETWIIPVSLYESYEQAMQCGMRTSIMEVSLMPNDSVGDIHRKIRENVEAENFWGTVVAVVVNDLMLTNRMISKLLKSTVVKKKRVGTFTNIGKWEGRDSAEDEAWSLVPPVHPGQPLGCGAIEYNGRLGLGLKLDPSLGFDHMRASALMNSWADSLLRTL